jgi:hypothetical protein
MRCRVAIVAVGGLALSLVLSSSKVQSASPPATATGTYTGEFTDTLIREAGGNLFFSEVGLGAYDGDISGPFTDTDIYIVHSDGSYNAYGTEVGEGCTIGGRTGNFTARWAMTGTLTPFTASGHLTFTGGTGGLAGLHGEGDFSEDSYSYNYHFEP